MLHRTEAWSQGKCCSEAHLLQQFDPCSFAGTFQSWLSFQDRLEPWDGPGPFQDTSSLGLNQAAP